MQRCNSKTATNGYMQMADNSLRRVPMVTVNLDTPYYVDTIEALFPPDAIYDAIIGHIHCAQATESPEPKWSKVGVVTRGHASWGNGILPLAVPKANLWKDIDRDKLARLQQEDTSIQKYKSKDRPMLIKEMILEEKDNVMYRMYKHPKVDGEKRIPQVIVPKALRHQISAQFFDSNIY